MSYFRSNIQSMSGYVPGEQPQGDGFIKLNTNENPYPPSPAVAVAVNEALQRGLQKYPDPMAEAFRRAGAAGLKRTVHAGESSGPEGVRDAIELLGADRIDHGVRAIEDPSVVGMLAERRIPLGVCPTSNLTLGVYPSMAEHPIERLRRAGVAVSVNTDDPALLATSLEREYALCSEAFAWSDAEVRAVARTSIDASFANDDVKARLREALNRW